MKVASDYFGILIPKGAPPEVYATMARVWEERVMTSPELQSYARERGAVFTPSFGEAAMAAAMPVIVGEACALKGRGEAVRDPSEFGITCP
jgi:hypothetical protein